MSSGRELAALVGVPVDHTEATIPGFSSELRADPHCPDCRGLGVYHRFLCACVTRRPVPAEQEVGA